MLNILQNAKNDIKEAISNQDNGYIDGGMVTYADSIRNIKHVNFIPTKVVPSGMKFRGSLKCDFSDYDFSNVTTGDYLFAETGYNLGFSGNLNYKWSIAETISLNNTVAGIKNCQYMFMSSVYTNPVIDMFPNATDCSCMFDTAACSTAIVNLPACANATNMFRYCNTLQSVTVNLPVCTKLIGLFLGCENLHSITGLNNTSNVTDFENLFNGCHSLRGFNLNISSAKNLGYTFFGCRSLTSVSLDGDGSNITNVHQLFDGCTALKTFNGIQNLGAKPDIDIGWYIGACENLSQTSIVNIIERLYDRTAAGYSIKTLKLHAKTLALLTDDDIAVATNKGWTIT